MLAGTEIALALAAAVFGAALNLPATSNSQGQTTDMMRDLQALHLEISNKWITIFRHFPLMTLRGW